MADFTIAKSNKFRATVGGVAGVDPRFVQIISVTAGSVVVQWSVAVPKDSVKDTGDLSNQILQRLTDDREVEFGKVSMVSIPLQAPLHFCFSTLPIRLLLAAHLLSCCSLQPSHKLGLAGQHEPVLRSLCIQSRFVCVQPSQGLIDRYGNDIRGLSKLDIKP